MASDCQRYFRLALAMDNISAIAFGLALRFVLDSVAGHDLRLTGTLVGLWEGAVTLHLLNRMPDSVDPYIAYLVRLLVDFLVTENILRLILVVVWTGLGMVLVDVAPAIWHDVGGHRVWRRFRRDMYYMSRSVPTVSIPPLFPRARVVRFSPVIQPTEISETLSTLSPTPATPTVTSQPPTTQDVPPTQGIPPTDGPVRTRRVPGGDVSVFSETNSDGGSVVDLRPPISGRSIGTSHTQYTVRPCSNPVDCSVSQAHSNSVDDSNLSSNASSASAETLSQQPQEEEIEIPIRKVDKGKGKVVDTDTSGLPPLALPPTPSDSNRPHFEVSRTSIVPTITGMPSIPDFYESALGSDWENIRKEEAEETVTPPTPPKKDFDSKIYESPPAHIIPPPASSVYEPTPRPSIFGKDLWDDVSNKAPSTPYPRPIFEQRMSRFPQPTISNLQAPEGHISQPIKKRKSELPPVPQTPVYGDTWGAEQDQIPPPTPSVLDATPMFGHTVGLSESVHPNSESLVPPAEHGRRPADRIPEQQDSGDTGFRDHPENSSVAPVQSQDQHNPQSVLPTFQQQSVPHTPREQSRPVPPPSGQQTNTGPLTRLYKTQTISGSPQQRSQAIPPIHSQKSRTVPSTPLHRTQTALPTPVNKDKARTVLPTPQHSFTMLLPDRPSPQLEPVLPEPIPLTPLDRIRNVPLPRQPPVRTVSSASQRPSKAVSSTPQSKTKTVSSFPQDQNIFDDFVGGDMGEFGLRGLTGRQQPPESNLGTGEVNGRIAGEGNKPYEGTKGEDIGETHNNNGNENKNDKGDIDVEADDRGGGDIQADKHNSPMSPVSSADSSIVNDPEIKERNKQAIIIRAQIQELTLRIENLEDEKLKAQGREELDPLSEESAFKEEEIQKAKWSLEKLKKRAEKRFQAAVESTGQRTVPWPLSLKFESSSPDDAALRLEDILGLMFRVEQEKFKIEIQLPKGNQGRAVKAAVQKVLTEYGIKAINKTSVMTMTMMPKAYLEMVTTFRKNHLKEEDDS